MNIEVVEYLIIECGILRIECSVLRVECSVSRLLSVRVECEVPCVECEVRPTCMSTTPEMRVRVRVRVRAREHHTTWPVCVHAAPYLGRPRRPSCRRFPQWHRELPFPVDGRGRHYLFLQQHGVSHFKAFRNFIRFPHCKTIGVQAHSNLQRT